MDDASVCLSPCPLRRSPLIRDSPADPPRPGTASAQLEELHAFGTVIETIERVAPGAKVRISPGVTPAQALYIIYAIFKQLREHVDGVQSGRSISPLCVRRHASFCIVAATPSEATANRVAIESMRCAIAAEWAFWVEVSSPLIGYGIFGAQGTNAPIPQSEKIQ